MARKKKEISEKTKLAIGIGLLLVGIALCVTDWLKTPEGQVYDQMSIKQLRAEMKKLTEAEDYENAALVRDLINQKKQKA